MGVLFTCGGTAGHINPTAALTQMFQTRNSGCEVLFVGTGGGMETRLVPEEGYPIKTVTITNFRWPPSPAFIGHNVRTLLNMNRSRRQANAVLDRFQPNLVVSTGDYASFPAVKTVAKRGIPTAIHKSNAVPGLTTETLSRVVNVVMAGFEESRNHYGDPGKVAVASTPVRTDFFRYTWKEARAELDLTDDRPLVLFVWGNLGTEVMNCQMAECVTLECQDSAPFHHIHGAGRDYRAVLDALRGSGLADHPEVNVWEYIYDMSLAMVAADLVLCRARTPTIAGIAAIAKPTALVPSPSVVVDHQAKNARMLASAGGAILLPEGESSEEKLYALMTGLLSDAPRREAMNRVLRNTAMPDVTGQIYQAPVRPIEERAN